MNTFQLVNVATTRRNIARRRAQAARLIGDAREVTRQAVLMIAWEARAKHYARKAGTRIVPMPDNPQALIAEAFLPLLPR